LLGVEDSALTKECPKRLQKKRTQVAKSHFGVVVRRSMACEKKKGKPEQDERKGRQAPERNRGKR